MELATLRAWGIAISTALIASALIVAAPWRASAGEGAGDIALFQLAQAEPAASVAPAPVAFVVRFRGAGPIARAQAMAARGREAEAARLIQAQLARQSAFSALCFDRFTVGATEVELRSCQDIAAADRATFQTRWLAQLNAMRAVEYADANAVIAPAAN